MTAHEKTRNVEWIEKAALDFGRATKGAILSDEFSQNPRFTSPTLLPKHESMVINLVKTLNMDLDTAGVGVLAEVMEIHEAVHIMRKHLGADDVPPDWRPRLIGDRHAGLDSKIPNSTSQMFPIRIGRQMVRSPIREVFTDVEMCVRDGVWYASLVLDQCPESGSERFSLLANRIGRAIPWTVHFDISPDGMSKRKMEQFFVGFLGGFGDYNKRIKKGWSQLRQLKSDGAAIVALRAVFTTWGSNENQCVDNLALLRSSIDSWGSAVATNETASPAAAALASCAGFTTQMPAPYLPAPLGDITRMMPMFRPSSIWKDGHLVARTAEGRPYPVKFGTSQQDFWGTGIFAPTGRGKSFLMNMLNFGILFSPGQTEVPYLLVIDVGPSAKLVMDLARALLPKHLADQVVSLRIRNLPE